MKILCVIDSLGSGGAQRQLVELAKGFKENGYEVSFLVYHEENFFKNTLEEIDIPVYALIEKNYLKRLFKARKFIRRHKADVVLSFLEAANFMCSIASFPTKSWTLIVGERSANPNMLKSVKLCFFRWFHLLADYVVANSRSNIDLVKKINPLIRNSKLKVIYNVVDENKWLNEKSFEYRKHGKLKIVVAASHQYVKNAKGLIEGVNLLSYEEKNKLDIEWYGRKGEDGTFELNSTLIENYNLQEIIKFYDATVHIKDKMVDADVVALFSFYEGLPNVICEAMMLGKTVISSHVSDVPIFLDSYFVFDPNNPFSIAEMIKKLLGADSKFIENSGIRNRKVAMELFDKNKNLNLYIKIFEE